MSQKKYPVVGIFGKTSSLLLPDIAMLIGTGSQGEAACSVVGTKIFIRCRMQEFPTNGNLGEEENLVPSYEGDSQGEVLTGEISLE